MEISLLVISLMGDGPPLWDTVSAQKRPLDIKDLTAVCCGGIITPEGALFLIAFMTVLLLKEYTNVKLLIRSNK